MNIGTEKEYKLKIFYHIKHFINRNFNTYILILTEKLTNSMIPYHVIKTMKAS